MPDANCDNIKVGKIEKRNKVFRVFTSILIKLINRQKKLTINASAKGIKRKKNSTIVNDGTNGIISPAITVTKSKSFFHILRLKDKANWAAH